MRARDIMSQEIWAVPTGTPAEEAWQLMRTQQVHHLLVGSATRPVGIVSARDLGGRAGAAVRKARTVGELMTTGVVGVDEGDSLRKIANTMRGRSIGCVLVSSGRRTVGIITVSDLLEVLGRGSEHPLHTTRRRTLSHRVPHRKMAAATGVW